MTQPRRICGDAPSQSTPSCAAQPPSASCHGRSRIARYGAGVLGAATFLTLGLSGHGLCRL